MPTETPSLFFESHNPHNHQTILLLHGLLSSHKEYDLVVPHLSAYHILAVDLNGHTRSAHLTPTTLSSCAENVARIISLHAKDGRAHVVGLSFGGFVGLALAKTHPSLVTSLFVTGAAPFEGFFRWMAERPSLIWYSLRMVMALPEWLYWKVMKSKGMARNEGLYADMVGNLTWENVRDGYTSILELSFGDVKRMEGVRILAVAGGEEDDIGSARKMGGGIREGGAVVVRGAVHAWDLQFPELFAGGVLAWVEGRELPVEFESLGV